MRVEFPILTAFTLNFTGIIFTYPSIDYTQDILKYIQIDVKLKKPSVEKKPVVDLKNAKI